MCGRGSNARRVAAVLALAVLAVGAGAFYMAPDVLDDVAGTITGAIGDVAPDVEQAIDTAADTVSNVVEDPESVADTVVDWLPDPIGPYVLLVDNDTINQPSKDEDKPQTPFDRTVWPTSPAAEEPPQTPRDPPAPDTKSTFIEQVEDHVHGMTNEERTSRGLRHLAGDGRLDGIARDHSQDMANRNYFSHDTPEGRDPTDRGTAVGYNCRKDYGSYHTYGLAENIYWVSRAGSNSETLAREIVDSWMGSPGHRQNILEPAYDALGVGIAISRTGAVYATQNFC